MTSARTSRPRNAAQSAVVRTIFSRIIWRHWKQETRRSLLLLILLAIGVAAFFSIRLANRAAVASFASFTNVVTKQTDAILAAPVGNLSDSILEELGSALKGSGVEIIPILELVAATPRPSEETKLNSRPPITLLGLDLIALQNLADTEEQDRKWFTQTKPVSANQSTEPQAAPNDLWRILNQPNAVFCSETMAREDSLNVGSNVSVVLNEKQLELEICGIIPSRSDQPAVPKNLLIVDLPVLQHLAGKQGQLDRIEFLFPAAVKGTATAQSLIDKIEKVAGERGRVKTPESRRETAAVMTQGFQLNLTILSLLALLVGIYLIFQSLDASVVRRRSEIATLRALGVTPREILYAWVLESLFLGIAGGVVGTFGGWLLAQGAVRVVSTTVNALYYATNVTAAELHFGETLLAISAAIACSMLAGWHPASRAALTPPAQLLTRGMDAKEPEPQLRAIVWGTPLFLAAIGLALLPPITLKGGGHFPLGGYLSALFGILGGGIITGELLQALGFIAAPLTKTSASIKLGNSHISQPTGRHRWAVAALLCAVAMTGGMIILVASFEKSVSLWIQHTLQADLYVTSDANQTATSYNRIPEATWSAIVTNPAVSDSDVALILPAELPKGTVRLMGTNLAFYERHNQFTWLQKPTDQRIYQTADNAVLCIVSEAFTERFGSRVGESLELPTPLGKQTLTIAGIYSDYGDEKGVIMVDRVHLSRWMNTTDASTLSLIASPGTDPLRLQSELRQRHPGLAVITNSHLRNEVMRIFRQTFAITYALEGIGILVSLVGLGTTLASILLERKNELTTLRSLGMTPEHIALATAWEGAAIAFCGAFGGLLMSVGLGAVLIYVVNKQTFGWTLQPVVPLGPLLALVCGVVLCGSVTAWCVGRWGSNLPADREP